MRNTLWNCKANQGFALIELLIVMAIIGIQAAVLISNLLNARRNANNTTANSFARNVTNWIASATATDPTTLTARDDAVLVAGSAPHPLPLTGRDPSLAALFQRAVIKRLLLRLRRQATPSPQPINKAYYQI